MTPRSRRFWLIKSEPHVYPWSRLLEEGKTAWTGVRNFEARNNLRAMQVGDLALYYHSGTDKALVGVARVCSPPRPDDTALPGEDWACVDVEPRIALASPMSLATIKADLGLKEFPLVTRSRLSVAPVSRVHFQAIIRRSGTRIPES